MKIELTVEGHRSIFKLTPVQQTTIAAAVVDDNERTNG